MICADCHGHDPDCYTCNGTGELCDLCGDPVNICECGGAELMREHAEEQARDLGEDDEDDDLGEGDGQ